MATPAASGSLRVHVVDGSRRPLAEEFDAFLRIFDSHRTQVASGFVTGPQAMFPALPLAENGSERYTIFAHARQFRDGVLFPVRPLRNMLVDAAVMLIAEKGKYRFEPLDVLEAGHPAIRRVICREKYEAMAKSNPRELAALLNVCTAAEAMPMPDANFPTPLDFYWQPEWDLLSPERVWAWVDARLVEAIRNAGCLRLFAPEAHPESLHPGVSGHVGPATASWREVRLPAANLRFTFHEHDRRTIDRTSPTGQTDSVDCVILEAAFEFWGDLLSLGMAEAVPPAETREKCSVEMAYQLRWMMTRQERLPEFNPPYRIE